MARPVLYLIVPCYNEEDVLVTTAELMLNKFKQLLNSNLIDDKSRILFVNDGSKDNTWDIINRLHNKNNLFSAIKLSRNFGHQNALLCGLMVAKDYADITITIDADGQDDINVINEMIEAYNSGYDIVYAVRNDRKTDSFFKRLTAELYYSFNKILGSEDLINAADFRLLSKKVVNELSKFNEANLYIRGIIPKIGFKSKVVHYKRKARLSGDTKYSLKKMISLAINGITNSTLAPLHAIIIIGFVMLILCLIIFVLDVARFFTQYNSSLYINPLLIHLVLVSVQLISLGIVAIYVGKIFNEVKHRPRYIIENVIGIDDIAIF